MKQTAPDFYLIAHSHGVSLLDGITDWRKQKSVVDEHDPRYGEAFQGWFNRSVMNDPFTAEVIDNTVLLNNIVAWVITSGSKIGPLAKFESENGSQTLRVSSKFSGIVNSWNGASPIVSMLNGNEHALTMLNRLPAYDFIDPEISAIEANVPIIDEMFIDQSIATWVSEVYYSLVAIKKLVRNKLIHVLPPPPRENPLLSQHFEVLSDLVTMHGFLSDQLRVKWYRRYCRRLTALLTSLDCNVVAPPSEACNSNGLLLEEFAEGLTHGNSKYGQLIAKQIALMITAE
jgi:hypothetical protein